MSKTTTFPPLQRAELVDPRYPVLFEVPGGEEIRLAREVEKRLIEHAAHSGVLFTAIRNWNDYLFAVAVAASSPDTGAQMEQRAEALLEALRGPETRL